MTDDIVTRSQQHGTHHEKTGTDEEYIGHLELKLDAANDEIERLKRILRHVASNNAAWADPDLECRTCNDIIKEFGR